MIKWVRFSDERPTKKDWTAETPFYFKGGIAVAFGDKDDAPLFLVWFEESADGLGIETTHWAELPDGPAES